MGMIDPDTRRAILKISSSVRSFSILSVNQLPFFKLIDWRPKSVSVRWSIVLLLQDIHVLSRVVTIIIIIIIIIIILYLFFYFWAFF